MLFQETILSIEKMEIRGAGRIARAAVLSLGEFAETLPPSDLETWQRGMMSAATRLIATRPTAVSLPNAVHLIEKVVMRSESREEGIRMVKEKARAFSRSSLSAIERIGKIGAKHIRDGDVVLTHCNSEAALRCILTAKEEGRKFSVIATEVRPGNQGLLTIETLGNAGINTEYIVDSAVRYFMNKVNLVVVGADAIVVNGSVVNKIGTSQIALAAHEARTPFMVAAETYKFAPRTLVGELIEIEERSSDEVLSNEFLKDLPTVTVRNPVFDVTPAEYIDLIVTEEGAIPPAMAYVIIRDYLGWDITEFQKETGKYSENME